MIPLTAAVLGLLCAWPWRAEAASAQDWRSRTIYQVMVDRFALPPGREADGVVCNTTLQLPCGGTWSGITNHLDYITDLGFTAIWISPIVSQLQVPLPPPADGTAYHGYWPADLLSLNSAYGTADDLHALVAAAHAKGMYVMMDVVVNHMAVYNTSVTSPNPSSNPLAGIDITKNLPFNNWTDYHIPFCPITDYNNQTNVEQCWLGSAAVPLADLNTESDTIVNFYYEWIAQTVANYSFDGLRIDTVKHVRKDFWPGFAESAGVFTLGEVLLSDAAYVGNYTYYIDAVFDYPMWSNLVQAFQTPGGSMDLLIQSMHNTSTYNKNGGLSTGVFLENHDQPRFGSLTQDQSLIKNAIMFTFVTDGIPVVYQGQEQGFTGGDVPNNREALWPTGYKENNDFYAHIQTLNQARSAAIQYNPSFLTTPVKVLSYTPHQIALLKSPIVAVFTNTGTSQNVSMAVKLDTQGAQFAIGTPMVELFSCEDFVVDGSGNLGVNQPLGVPRLYLPASALGSTLCSSSAASNSSSGSGSGSSNSTSDALSLPITSCKLLAFTAAVLGLLSLLIPKI